MGEIIYYVSQCHPSHQLEENFAVTTFNQIINSYLTDARAGPQVRQRSLRKYSAN